MQSSQLAQAAYAQPTSPARTARGTEHAAFQSVTSDLQRVNRGGVPFASRVSALHENRRLWTVLATNVLDPDNSLPPATRAGIVYLHEFTELHSRSALRDGGLDLSPMIEINTAIMRGLRGEERN